MARRNHGTGSLTPLGGDRWRSRIRLDGGIRDDKTIYAPTRKEAEATHRQRLVAADAGDLTRSPRTVADLIDAWLPTLDELADYTARNYRHAAEKHIRPKLGAVRLDKLTGHHLHKLYEPMKPDAARTTHAAMSNALRRAVAWGWVKTSVAKGNGPRKPVRERHDPPAPAQVLALMSEAIGPEMGTFLHLVATTGMRRGEACALRWEDVDLDAGHVVVRHAVSKIKGQPVAVKGTKTGNTRTVGLDAGTVAVLRRHRQYQRERALAAGAGISAKSYLFSGHVNGGQPWDPRIVTMRFARLRQRAGLEGVRLHDLRHFVATELIGSGMNARSVAERLGHKDPNLTLSLYAHALKAQDQAAAEHMGRLIPDRATAG